MGILGIDADRSNARGRLVLISLDGTIAAAARRPDFSTIARDVPTTSTIANQWYNNTTIPSSPGWMRPKRIGSAEPAVGTWPHDSTALDINGSTWFSYPGLPAGVASGGLSEEFVVGDIKPGGSSIDERWTIAVDFYTTSPTIDFRIFASAANASFGALFVDGHPAFPSAVVTTSGSGVGCVQRFTFTSTRMRRITAYLAGSVQFGGIAVEPGHLVRKAPAPTYLAAILSDSYGGGAGGVSRFDTGPWKAALKLGADAVMDAAIGGTGIVKTLTGAPTSNFAGRAALINAAAPKLIIVAGGRNDVQAGLQAATTSLLASLTAAKIRTVPTASESGQATVRAALQAAAGTGYTPTAIDALPKVADNVHPTLAGHEVLAYDIAVASAS